jgi:hypothetical protein
MGGNAGGGNKAGGGGGGVSELDRIRQVKALARENERNARVAIKDEFGNVISQGYQIKEQPYARLNDAQKGAVQQAALNSYQSLYTRVGDVRGRFRFNDTNAEANKIIGRLEGVRQSAIKQANNTTDAKVQRQFRHKALASQNAAYRTAVGDMSLKGPLRVGPVQARVK